MKNFNRRGMIALRSNIVFLGSLCLFISLQTLSGSSLNAQERLTPTDGLTLPDASITTRSDVTSMVTNPAGLAFMQGIQTGFVLESPTSDYQGVQPEGMGLFIGAGNGVFGFGLGLEGVDRPELGELSSRYRKYTLAAAIGSESNVSFGGAFHFFGSNTDQILNELTSWDIGLMWRASKYLGFGLNLQDLNQPFFHDPQGSSGGSGEPDLSALPMRLSFGAALRLWDGRAELDPALAFSTSGESIYLQPRLSLEPIPGLQVFARTEFDFNVADRGAGTSWNQTVAGLALNMGDMGIESAALAKFSGDNAGMLGSSHLLWLGSQRERALIQNHRRWILVDLLGGVDEQPSSGFFAPTVDSFLSLVLKLERLAADETVEGVVFNIGESGLGYAQVWEVRQAIARLNQAGKKTVSILTNPSFRQTLLASAAADLWLIPPEPYAADGLSTTLISYAQTLAMAGIQAEFMRIGSHKSAPESYTHLEPSDESLAQSEAYLDALYRRSLSALAADRGISSQQISDAVDQTPIFPADALKKGLADRVIYLDMLDEELRRTFGPHVRLERDYPGATPADMRWGSRPEVAVVVISGMIVRGKSGRTPLVNEVITGSDTLTAVFQRLRRDPAVRAVVVRVDSPGGSATASDLIFRELRRLAEHKPVVASMGNVAASGGYYTAAGANEIFATPNTLTGSIGIFAGKFNIARLAELLGVHTTQLSRGEQSGAFGIFQPWSDSQREGVGRTISYLYELFIQQMARTRPLSVEEIDAAGRGRIWDGEAAKTHQLVDEVGGLNDALRRAAALADIAYDEVDYRLYPENLGLFDISASSVQSKKGALESVAELFGLKPSPSAQNTAGALFGALGQLGRGVLLPILYADEEALALLPLVFEVD